MHSRGFNALLLLLTGAMLFAMPAFAAERIRILGLFTGKALVEIDGKRHLMKAGERSPEGVTLVSATAEEAVIERDGKRERFGLGSDLGGGFAEPQMTEVKITRAANGAYYTTGSINGRLVEMMVDTGATAVALSEREAKRLGLQYRLDGERTYVRTASGLSPAYAVILDKVQVGSIVKRRIQGVVVQGDSPERILLGMSFLNQVQMENRGNLMMLRSRN